MERLKSLGKDRKVLYRKDCVRLLLLLGPGNKIWSLEKNLNVSRPSEHPPVRGGEMSKRLGEIVGCKDKTSTMAFNRVPRW